GPYASGTRRASTRQPSHPDPTTRDAITTSSATRSGTCTRSPSRNEASSALEAGEPAEEALAVELGHRLLVDEVPRRGKSRDDAEPVKHPRGGSHALGCRVHRARHELGEVEVGGLENLAVRLAAVLPDDLHAELPVGAKTVHALRV